MEIPGHMKVSDALKMFYGSQKLGREAFEDDFNWANFNGIQVPYPNLPWRKKMMHLHDVNHVLTEYDTSWIGEGEIAAFELASGYPGKTAVAYLYAPFSLAIGFLFSPSRIIQAFRRGLCMRNACHLNLSKEILFNSTVAELRATLGIHSPFEKGKISA